MTVSCLPHLTLDGEKQFVSRFGVEELFEAVGRPVRYATHQEIFLKGRDLP